MNVQIIWSQLKMMFLYLKILFQGIYLYSRFKSLQVWYFIFTPKNAKHIEDVPLLDKAHKDLNTWYFYAAASLAIKGLSPK